MSADDDELKPIGKPHDVDEVIPSRFIKAGELHGKTVTVTLASADFYMLPAKKGGKERRVVLEFEPSAKQRELGENGKLFTLNRTNTLCLKAMFGRELQKWVGKRVTIFPDIVREAGMMKGDPCIRMWGSPDIAHDMDVQIALRKRTPYTLTMHRVAGNAPSNAKRAADAPREPGSEG